ncbi:uncharacterized protein LOC126565491 [Anopheles maculipalpis]|uniref:uncharacterized protein LOC126565491 n=1 Tax=Anopheles maculipalpis TaxID=1496333 RepID=UPI0021590F43|nr:uncharacterized protein LOC126565491 [Anopheles maculipalpis]
MAETKYSCHISNLKELKDKMSTMYKIQSDEQQQEIPSQWETIYCNVKSVIDQLKIHNLKAQGLQHTEPWSEKDMVNLIKILELTYTCLKDCGYINQFTEVHDEMSKASSTTAQQPTFGEQMAKLKQQIDLVSFEVTKLRKVKEALDNIYSNYNMELAVSSSEQNNEEEADDVFN